MVIIIYSKSQVAEFSKTKEIEAQVQDNCIQPTDDNLINDACITKEETTSELISINNAPLEELIKIPNIGESKAQDIIAYREENNGFTTIEDIMNVPGIGEATFAKIKDYITL